MNTTNKLKRGDATRLSLDFDGAPVANHAWIEAIGQDVVAIGVDMGTKRCVINAVGYNGTCPCVTLGADENTLYLNRKKLGKLTEISFPDFAGWRVWCADVSRYTVSVCLCAPDKI